MRPVQLQPTSALCAPYAQFQCIDTNTGRTVVPPRGGYVSSRSRVAVLRAVSLERSGIDSWVHWPLSVLLVGVLGYLYSTARGAEGGALRGLYTR